MGHVKAPELYSAWGCFALQPFTPAPPGSGQAAPGPPEREFCGDFAKVPITPLPNHLRVGDMAILRSLVWPRRSLGELKFYRPLVEEQICDVRLVGEESEAGWPTVDLCAHTRSCEL